MVALEGLVIAWDVLMFLAILLLVLALVPPLFSRRVMRRKTWHTLMLSLLIFSIGEVLLVGNQKEFPNPNLCLVQTALIYSTPPFLGFATLSYSADIYISIRRMFKSGDWEDGPEPQDVVILVLAPWIAFFLVFLTLILVVGLPQNSAVILDQHYFYCHTKRTSAVAISAVSVTLTIIGAIGLQAATGWTLYHNWIKVQKVSVTSTTRKYFHAFLRTITFTALGVIGVILSFVATATVPKTLVGFSMLLPSFPIGAALIFGTYQDIMSFYVCWR